MPIRVAVFCTPEPGHFQLLRPLIRRLARGDADVRVYTDASYGEQVRNEGAAFEDLFNRYPLDAADNTSIPIPCRYVSYAAHYARDVAEDVKAFQPSIVVCETFSLIGRVIAEILGIPWVNVSPGHDLNPARYVKQLTANPLLNISAECHRGVELLERERLVPNASPFSFVTSLSPFLNICCEPPTFLENSERQAFEPLAFFGSLGDDAVDESESPASTHFERSAKIRVYASFGRIVWRYYRTQALGALRAISDLLSSSSDFEGMISLGGEILDESERASLESSNVTVRTSVDQMSVLAEADVFITHHGINSTHEAILNRVPMLSYPFFWDQPSMAAKCQDMGIAVPLSQFPCEPLSADAVAAAMHELLSNKAARLEKLERLRSDELAVIENREMVIQQVMELAAK